MLPLSVMMESTNAAPPEAFGMVPVVKAVFVTVPTPDVAAHVGRPEANTIAKPSEHVRDAGMVMLVCACAGMAHNEHAISDEIRRFI